MGGDRIPCSVPHCRRTCPRKPGYMDEWICGKHWAMTDKRLRRLLSKCRRVADRYPDRYDAAARVFWRTWDRLKKQAIERAMGISA